MVNINLVFFIIEFLIKHVISIIINEIFFYKLDEDKWKTEAKTEEGAVQEYTISYQNLVPESTYLFRVIAYNKYSISYPAESQDEVNIKNICCNFFRTQVSLSLLFYDI